MKNFFRFVLILAMACGAIGLNTGVNAQFYNYGGEAGAERRTVLTIRADGSCQSEDRLTLPRKTMEQQIRMMDRYGGGEESSDEDQTKKSDEKKESTPKPLTDEELKKKVLARYDQQHEAADPDTKAKTQVDISADSVIVTSAASYASLEAMLRSPRNSLGAETFNNVRIEQDTNSHLRMTFTAQKLMNRHLKAMRSSAKMSGMNAEVKLVLPGKVLSSGFTEMDGNTTRLVIDAKKDESLDAYLKIFEGPVVVVAELGGLVIKEPLESQKLRRSLRMHDNENDDLPLVEGGAGFVARSEGLVTTTVHVFPEGKNYFNDGNSYRRTPGTVVSAKIFPPRGRILQSLTAVRVVKAMDDKGRAVAASVEDDETAMTRTWSGGGGDGNNSMQIQLQLQLPQPDAQAIDELSAEAIAVSAGSWKEMVLTNLTETSINEFDVSGALAGAKLKITKLAIKNNMLRLEGQLKGPPTVSRVEVKVKMPEGNRFNQFNMGNFGGGAFRAKGDESTRSISINMPMYNPNGEPATGPVTLQIRYPEDLRREKIAIKLTGLDLL